MQFVYLSRSVWTWICVWRESSVFLVKFRRQAIVKSVFGLTKIITSIRWLSIDYLYEFVFGENSVFLVISRRQAVEKSVVPICRRRPIYKRLLSFGCQGVKPMSLIIPSLPSDAEYHGNFMTSFPSKAEWPLQHTQR